MQPYLQQHCHAATSLPIEALYIAIYVRCITTYSGMFHEESVGNHPFVINTPLMPEFGYTKAFLDGELPWPFAESTSVSEGGGRVADVALKKLVVELLAATADGEELEARQILVKSMFGGHYDAPRVLFIAMFFLGDVIKSSTTKQEAIDLLADNNIPFIPWPILSHHLEVGLALHKSGARVSKLSWAASYEAFCKRHPFDKAADTDAQLQAKSLKLAKSIAFWQKGIETHNESLDSKHQVKISDADFLGLTGSQFSVSNGGTPTPNLKMEGLLREKLMLAL